MIGRKLSHYEITGFLGKGGMGEVYQARDTRLDRDVALKVMPAEFARDSDRLARFRREAKVLASLNHPNIAAIHGLDEDGGEIFLAMELVEGEDLAQRLKQGPLDLEDTLLVARQLAEGLEAAHESGVVHRDLKPANLKFTPEGEVKILDFGLARAYLGDEDGPVGPDDPDNSPTMTAALTQQGMILGTAAYMSPEQARGRAVDHRSDIWAFGAILFEMLTGRRLFEGETVSDIVAAVLRADLDLDLLPEDTPNGVRRLLKRCLERDSRRRLRDIGEARVRLERWRENPSAIHESAISFASDLEPLPRRRALVPWVLGAVALLAVAGLGFELTRNDTPPPRLMSFEIDVPGEGDITVSNGKNVMLSPDGGLMGWLTPQGIYLREVGEREVRLLEGTENAVAATFSPDGLWVGFVARSRLQRISVAGGAPFEICDAPTPRGIAWVDESTLVFAPGISDGLLAVSLADGVPRVLTTKDPARSERSHRWPTAVPGRRAVLFECQYLGRDYDQGDIQIVDLDGGDRRTVHRGGAAPVCTEAGNLFFVRGHVLYALAFDLDRGETSGLPVPVLENVDSSVGNQEDDDGSAQYAIDETGSLFYMSAEGTGRGRSRLILVDLATGAIEDVGPAMEQRDVLMSPDGNMIAVSRGPEGEEELYIVDLSNGNETMLTRRPSVEYLGAWTPDSRTLYWTQASDDGAHFEIWRRRIDGATPAEQVIVAPPGGGAWVSSVSPDGRTLLANLWKGADRNNIYSLDLTDPAAELTPFIESSADNYWGRFVGDGSYIMYSERISGDNHNLFLRRFPDTGALWSFVGPEGGYVGAWWNEPLGGLVANDADGLVVLSLEMKDDGAVLGLPRRHRIFGGGETPGEVYGASVNADGGRMACLVLEDTGEIEAEASLVYVVGWEQELGGESGSGR